MVIHMSNSKNISRDSTMKSVFVYFLGIFLLIGAILIGTISLLYNMEAKDYLSRIELEEKHSLRLQREIIRKSIGGIVSDLLFLSKQNELLAMLDTNDISQREGIAQEYLQFSRKKKIYDQIRFLDEDGMEIVRVNYNDGAPRIVDGSGLQSKGSRYYFKDTYALGDGEIFVSPFDLNIENGKIETPFKPMIRFGVPIYDGHRRKRGAIVLNYLGTNILSRMREIAALFPGNIMLVNADGYWLCSPSPADDWGFMLEGRENRQFKTAYPHVWRKISTSGAGQVHNEKGLFTDDTIYPIPEGIGRSPSAAVSA